jgi:hypothetical protein
MIIGSIRQSTGLTRKSVVHGGMKLLIANPAGNSDLRAARSICVQNL